MALIGPYPADPSRISGGVPAATFYLAQGLREDPEIELHVIAPIKNIERDSVVRDGNITVHYLALAKKRLMPNLLSTVGRVRSVLEEVKPDIVHGEHVTGAAAGLDSGIATLYTVHGILHREVRFQSRLTDKLGMMLEARMAKKAIPRLKHCVAISSYAARAYAPMTAAKWHYIANPVEDRFFDLESREVPGKMLYAGVITRRKNVTGLVRAFDLAHQRASDAELFICGKVVHQDHFDEAARYIREHGLEESVHLFGFISQEELGRHFSEAAAICLFSLEETAPILLAQAMCAGKAVIASAGGGTPELVIDGETGFVVGVGDERAFAEKSLLLLSDDKVRRKMGVRAREVAEQRYRKEIVAAKTKEVYLEMLNERGGNT